MRVFKPTLCFRGSVTSLSCGQVLNNFDVVGTIDRLDFLWRYLCEYMEMDKYPLSQVKHPIIKIPVDELQTLKCVDFPKYVVNSKKTSTSALSPKEEYDQNLELAKIMYPVSFRVWEEFNLQSEDFVYFYNKTLSK